MPRSNFIKITRSVKKILKWLHNTDVLLNSLPENHKQVGAIKKHTTRKQNCQAKELQIGQDHRLEAQLLREKEKLYKIQIAEARDRERVRQAEGKSITWWECKGCGNDSYEIYPPIPCPKCGSLAYEKIKQRLSMVS